MVLTPQTSRRKLWPIDLGSRSPRRGVNSNAAPIGPTKKISRRAVPNAAAYDYKPMTCYYPLSGWRARLPTEKGKYGIVFKVAQGDVDRPISVPCGRCTGCRLDRSLHWAVRCYHEAQLYEFNSFVTLTYDDEHLPPDRSLSVRTLQLFIKKLRKANYPGIRFYACGEYGSKLSRPHYHLCLFNYRPPDLKPFKKNKQGDMLYSSDSLDTIWANGYTQTGELTFQSAAYVARYIMKKLNGDMADHHYQYVNPLTGEIHALLPEFTTQSNQPGIGKPWLEKYNTEIYNYDECVLNGKKSLIPLYYDRQIEITDPELHFSTKLKRKRNRLKNRANNTSNRLRIRETVQLAKLKQLKRGLDE